MLPKIFLNFPLLLLFLSCQIVPQILGLFGFICIMHISTRHVSKSLSKQEQAKCCFPKLGSTILSCPTKICSSHPSAVAFCSGIEGSHRDNFPVPNHKGSFEQALPSLAARGLHTHLTLQSTLLPMASGASAGKDQNSFSLHIIKINPKSLRRALSQG